MRNTLEDGHHGALENGRGPKGQSVVAVESLWRGDSSVLLGFFRQSELVVGLGLVQIREDRAASEGGK